MSVPAVVRLAQREPQWVDWAITAAMAEREAMADDWTRGAVKQ